MNYLIKEIELLTKLRTNKYHGFQRMKIKYLTKIISNLMMRRYLVL